MTTSTEGKIDAQALEQAIRAHMAEQGRKGGQSKSAKKVAAALVNVEKANAARWKKDYTGRIAKKGRRK